MISTIFSGLISAFFAASGLTKLIMIGSVIAALGIGYGGWYIHVYNKGYNAAIAAIARQDAKAIARATAARSAVNECADRGLRWDQSTGKCEGG